ncbi:MAG: 2OG-Fe(II) oxygenase [Armatimonadota bacterium]
MIAPESRLSANAPSSTGLEEAVRSAVAARSFEEVRKTYWDQNECLFLDPFLPRDAVEAELVPAAQRLRSEMNRNFIPGHKKGGSVSYYQLQEHAPAYIELYRSPAFIDFLSRLVGAELMTCPEDDPHSCALYYYTEPGDHIGFHYDTSYYKGARYTVLLGIVERSPSCRLVCQLYKDDPHRETEEVRLATEPGSLVVFNGDKLWHAVTPLAAGEERIVLTLEYVTNQEMGRFQRIFSNLKDAFAYFGIKGLLKKKRR